MTAVRKEYTENWFLDVYRRRKSPAGVLTESGELILPDGSLWMVDSPIDIEGQMLERGSVYVFKHQILPVGDDLYARLGGYSPDDYPQKTLHELMIEVAAQVLAGR